MSAVAVRPAAAADAAPMYRAWQSLRDYYASVDARIILAPISEAAFVGDFIRRLAREDLAAFVAIDGTLLAGFITGGIEANQPDRLPKLHATVGHLFVEPSFRRRGVAKSLFGALSAWAGSQTGVSHFEMPVLARDEDAVHFWASIGFAPFIERLWAPLQAAGPDA
jgi:GNAT superfamily N-acetyltransferase